MGLRLASGALRVVSGGGCLRLARGWGSRAAAVLLGSDPITLPRPSYTPAPEPPNKFMCFFYFSFSKNTHLSLQMCEGLLCFALFSLLFKKVLERAEDGRFHARPELDVWSAWTPPHRPLSQLSRPLLRTGSPWGRHHCSKPLPSPPAAQLWVMSPQHTGFM